MGTGRTIGSCWDKADRRPAGFDLLRVTLALAVILWHTASICYGLSWEQRFAFGPVRPFVAFIVPAFFALSGFLVAGSLERNNILSFFTLRVLRIFPALVFEVTISALLIGPLFTTLPLSQYFLEPGLHAYFLNVIGDIHFGLPGVFYDLPAPGFVNVQLWTIPFELKCYLIIGAVGVLRLTRRPMLFLVIVLAMLARTYFRMIQSGHWPMLYFVDGTPAILCFLFGVAFYLLRNRMAASWPLFVVSTLLCAALLSSKYTAYLASIPLVYTTVFIGVQSFKLPYLATAANYSYGVYLYGYPVQQALSALFPHYRIWYVNFILGTAITLAFAVISWTFLESKVMARRKSVLAPVDRFYDRLQRAISPWSAPLGRRMGKLFGTKPQEPESQNASSG